MGAKNIIAQEASNQQSVYLFSQQQTDGHAELKNLLGGKGANLAEMANLGLPVPPGFTLTTEVCQDFYDQNESHSEALKAEVIEALTEIETQLGRRFGDEHQPLLLSIRSGARTSMPGMMDTVLNLGLNDTTAAGLAKESQDPRFAYDSYRRFIQMYSNVVLGVDHYEFEDVLETFKRDLEITEDTDISATDWQDIIVEYKKIVKRVHGTPFPQDVQVQLWSAIGAVFKSWMTRRAITYRQINNIPSSWGTAVNVQAMVFGNMGENCATGVAFTRNPSTGENAFYGEYLMNAQGEDVVAGIRTPQCLTLKEKRESKSDLPCLEEQMPKVFEQLCNIRTTLEKHYKDIQDIEFTIQQGKLYMLQTRTGKRTAKAALKIAVDMVNDGVISKEEALLRLDANALEQLLHPSLDPKAQKTILTSALPASPGAASGEIVFDSETAERRAQQGIPVILCRTETSPEDIQGMHVSKGILTTRGGMTSHAAVVARGMGRTCVAGAGAITIDYKEKTMTIAGQVFSEGDIITLDGGRGEVIKGAIATVAPDLSDDFETLMTWADDVRRLSLRVNAETIEDAKTALRFGAEGIGLCRTEHMFFDPNRILNVRKMILAETDQDRQTALNALEPEQTADFKALFEIMAGLPVTIRLLDPPLHEFLPQTTDEIKTLAEALNTPVYILENRIKDLHESNPMLGHRGCRLGISHPEIYKMQARAIFKAALSIQEDITPEIMIPLAVTKAELDILKAHIDQIATEIMTDTGETLTYKVGAMIELPRAALRAEHMAETADFFSFGTNDLTQTTLGISRDDAARFLSRYTAQGLFKCDPFVSLDIDGVGRLVEMACQNARRTAPDMKLGICGEHGGDPDSIQFFEDIKLDYISCSPYRVPIARLAAAQAFLNAKQKTDQIVKL